MTPRRLKSTALLAVLAVNALTLISWTQVWFTVRLVDAAQVDTSIAAAGDSAAGGLAALGLAGLALAGALSIAGPAFRLVLGVLHALLGVAVIASSLAATGDPVGAVSAPVTELTGVTGDASVASLVESVSNTPWPFITLALGIASVGIGVGILVTSRSWPGSSRKYQTAGLVPVENADHGADAADSDTAIDTATADVSSANTTGATRASGARAAATTDAADAEPTADRGSDSVADWDALSDGGDPTAR
ncbi:Trp biosynthesis-associated membrane protein [Marisediminicola sp. LYQ134]|uniref:Trp biosynthesis-associated membrane protein n=1 Tax=unclassified Marisediminicola TaxID=2618316 RepID=UPI0039830F36